MDSLPEYGEVLEFWFAAAMRPHWFASTPEIDRTLRDRFEPLWQAARNGGRAHWLDSPDGALALVIVLDQFPLNMYRGRAEAYAGGELAVAAAREALARGYERLLAKDRLAFLFLPFMHSEEMADQERSVALFRAAGLDDRWAAHHRDLVRRFGRFPHRNAALGRPSSEAERAYLAEPGAFKG